MMCVTNSFRKILIIFLICIRTALLDVIQPQASPRIIGGSNAQIESFPYLVSVTYNGYHSCGGSAIGSNYVLTAAHCVYGRTSDKISVRAGSSDSRAGGVIYQPEKIVYHKDYNRNGFSHDVALIKLINSKITTIPLAASSESLPATGTITGWGKTSETSKVSRYLKSARVNIYSFQDCQRMLKGYSYNENMICAANLTTKTDTCQGDSGGPLIANGKVFGIVSWGVGCGQHGFPGVFASVPAHRAWIDNITK